MAKLWNIFKKKEAVQEKKEELLEINESEHKEKNEEISESVTTDEIEEKIPEEHITVTNVKQSWFERLKSGLSKTRENFTYNIRKVLNFGKIDAEALEELEELFIKSDLGTELTIEFIEKIDRKSVMGEIKNSDELIAMLKKEFVSLLKSEDKKVKNNYPKVVLIVGINGVGKTTTIGKLSNIWKKSGKKVLMVAGDTFRAAAIEQLEIWSNRTGVQLVKHSEGSDSAAVVYDGVTAGVSRNMDVIIADTAGRLHNKVNLMKELEKIKNVIRKANSSIDIETLLVIDATGGQNSLIQAKIFSQSVEVDGIVLTKMDGTARGGIILPIVKELGIPVRYIGVGETVEDLKEFSAEDFVNALFD